MKFYASGMLFVLAMFVVGAAAADSLAAQCGGGGCGGCGASKKKAVRVEPKKNGGCPGGRCGMRGESTPSVQCDGADAAALEKAANGSKPIVVLFAGEKTDVSEYFQGQDYVDMKDNDAVFIAIPYTSDRTPAPGAKESIVPTSKLAGDNPARDYGVRAGEEVVMLLDSYGNLTDVGTRFTKKPTVKELREAINRMPSKVSVLAKKLQKHLDGANSALAKGDRVAAFRAAVKVLESGVVGYEVTNEAVKVYNSICDEVVSEIGNLKSGDSKEAAKKLGELAGVFNKKNAPGVAAEIDAARKELRSMQ